jgi:phosphoglycolate phosphatase
MRRLIVFDLDGTLIDSAKDLAISMNATREHLQLPPLDPQLIYSFVGNGAAVLVRRALGPDADADLNAKALAFFLTYYRAHALEHTCLYAGVREVVEQLAAANYALAVLTNKPVRISRDIIFALGLGQHFQHIYGGDSFPTKKPDPQGLLALLSETGTAAADAWMVGDSGVDVQTARNAGIHSCGVTWGFQPDACTAENPDVLIDQPAQLFKFLNAEAIKLREPT